MSLFSNVEKAIERGFHRWTEHVLGPAESDQLLVVHRAILAEVEGRIQTLARGDRVFPYELLTVTLVTQNADQKALYESEYAERLTNDVREALEAAGCRVPGKLQVEVKTADSGSRPFEIIYRAKLERPPTASAGRLVVVKGATGQAEHPLEQARTNIGRLAELTDADSRVIRRNHIVFAEGDEVNSTVSRRHAHIVCEEGGYRIVDDGSEFGTRVFREGRSLDVPSGNRRGERLKPGDEIYLGRACLRFEVG